MSLFHSFLAICMILHVFGLLLKVHASKHFEIVLILSIFSRAFQRYATCRGRYQNKQSTFYPIASLISVLPLGAARARTRAAPLTVKNI